MKKILKFFVNLVYESRKVNIELKNFAKNIKNSNILEIGSGKNPCIQYFDKSNNFVMTDIHPMNFKTIKLDICNMKYKNIYDLIVCINVLDDVYDFKKTINNVYKAVKNNGQIYFVVNGLYPLHDLPNDYWRFTEYSLKKIFSSFNTVKIKTIGYKYFPFYYIIIAKK